MKTKTLNIAIYVFIMSILISSCRPARISPISAGSNHSCLLTATGEVKCWGNNMYGKLGDGTAIKRPNPVDVIGLTDKISAISAGGTHTCALTEGGGIKCWGRNDKGQLGDGTTIDRFTPVDVVGLESGVSAIVAGGFHSCALMLDGQVKCWGLNIYGQLGDGTTAQRSVPVDVVGLTNKVSAITACGMHTCALTSNGGVKCWGYNIYGQLGDNTTTQRPIPVDAIGLTSKVSAITAGGKHTCAVTSNGGVKCWGYNIYGQLGHYAENHTPADVIDLDGKVSAISAGADHTCALMMDGGVKCWGGNGYGELGDGTTTTRVTPMNVIGLTSGVNTIDAGGSHTCVQTSDNVTKCWGWNPHGELGDGTDINRNVPVDILP